MGKLRLPVCLLLALAMLAGGAIAAQSGSAAEPDPCAPPVTNEVACENTKPGDPPTDWQISGIGDPTIQGYATQMSVNVGQTVNFKIDTPASSYHIDILRLGYYEGDGARLIASNVKPTASLPQKQPSCLTDSSSGLIDCGNWGVSASWTVPSNAVSGLYMAHLVRNDTGGESQIFFVVRNDASHSAIVLKTADSTWEAYNAYGGNSLYTCTVSCPPGNPGGYKAAFAVSYNRPFDGTIPTDNGYSDPFYAEYQLIRFLEANGYDLSYVSQHDLDTSGSLLQNHKVFVSSGHDEYWSAAERESVEAARGAGVSLSFFSGNELFWKTRWTASSDGSNTPYRTLVDYKDTHFAEPVDPAAPVTTGTWRDPRFSPPRDAGKPELSLTGQSFIVNAGTSDIQVPGTFAKLRFWRNTAVSGLSPSQTLTLSPGTGTLGYEWDVAPDNGFRPAGRISLSSTTVSGTQSFTDYGTEVENNVTQTHSLSLYRAASGALVFGAGTVQWSWGLDRTNAWGNSAPESGPPDPTMQQATVNLLADMGAQPATLQSGLVATGKSTDTTAPSATVSSPSSGANISDGQKVTISGTATDAGGGIVAATEVSTDGGATWHPAKGTASWTYSWIADGSPGTTIKARAVDDSGNVGAATAGTPVNVSCPCSVFGELVPEVVDSGDNSSVELGVKFKSDVAGQVTGIRFYKSAANTGTHVGSLWDSEGNLLAQATFSGESGSGWQQVTFPNPVAIQANTVYVAGYLAPNGHYAVSGSTVNHPPAVGEDNLDSAPLHVLPDSQTDNGLYQYTQESVFPTGSFQSSNYWVDVVFAQSAPAQPPGQPTGVSATAGTESAIVNWTAPSSGGSPSSYRVTPYIGSTAQAPVTVSAPASSKTVTGLTAGTAYNFTVTAVNSAGTGPESAHSNSVTPTTPPPSTSIFGQATPGTVDAGDGNAVELGVKFKSDVAGQVTGIRFYKAAANTGTHVGSLWSSTGTLLAEATFSGETASGWQQVSFPSPVAIQPNTTYVAGYLAPNGHYSANGPSLANGVDNAPLHALANSTSLNGVYAYGKSSAFPTSSYQSSNYWVDVLFSQPPSQPPGQPTGVSATAGFESAIVNWTAPSSGGSPSSYRVTPYIGSTAQTPVTVSAPASSKSITGLTPGTAYNFTVTAINAVGPGPESSHSNSVTPTGPTAPGAPTAVIATAGSGQATVKWTAPASDGSSPIVSYRVTPYIGSTAQAVTTVSGSSTQATVGSLTNGTTYDFTVTAVNAIGAGPESAHSNSVTPTAPSPPSAPTAVSATAGTQRATVKWTPPSSEGTSPITGYRVTPYVGSTALAPVSVGASSTSATVEGLTAGTAYDFTVTAVNAVGAGPESAHSNSVTPTPPTPPDAPTAVSAAAGIQQATVNWTSPSNEGSSPITSYRVTPYIGSTAQAPVTVSAPASSKVVTGLTAGTAYSFTVTAINAVGASPESTHSSAVTPTAPPANTSIFGQATPGTVDSGDGGSVELGVKFRSDVAGQVTGIRFYKAAANTGTHVGSLWSSEGALLAQATFSGESASGWQQMSFASPVSIQPETTYVAGYLAPKGHYSVNGPNLAKGVDNAPLHAIANSTSPNGLFAYGASSVFPTSSFQSSNYWVDVVFAPSALVQVPGQPTAVTATAGSGSATVSWTAPSSGGSPASYRVTPYIGSTAQAPVTVSAPASSKTVTGLTAGTAYSFTVTAVNSAGSGPESAHSNSVTPTAPPASTSIFGQATPGTVDSGDGNSVELGVKFQSDVAGQITGIRFYKAAANAGTHVGSLWDSEGTLLAQASFSGESASGWQQVTFASPVAIQANTTYVAGYLAPNGHYSVNGPNLASGVDNAPLHAIANSTSPNGIYAYGPSAVFPTSTFNSTNYWVDVLFNQ